MDAAVTAAIALTVVEPCNNGVGSDAFAIVGRDGDLTGLNASGRSPAGWTAARFSRYSGHADARLGHGDRSGGRECVGGPVATVRQTRVRRTCSSRRSATPATVSTSATRRQPSGRTPARSFRDIRRVSAPLPAHWTCATTGRGVPQPRPRSNARRDRRKRRRIVLPRRLGRTDRGRRARRSAGPCAPPTSPPTRRNGSPPFAKPYRDIELAEIPPNGQGLAAQIALAILAHIDAPSHAPGSAEWTHLQVEAMKVAIRAAFDHFADPHAMHRTPQELLDPGSIAAAAATIGPRASPLPPVALPVSRDTVYLTAADSDGTMVSMIQSNYMGFGSGDRRARYRHRHAEPGCGVRFGRLPSECRGPQQAALSHDHSRVRLPRQRTGLELRCDGRATCSTRAMCRW